MTKKIAISVQDDLLARVDATSRQDGLSRSALFARAAAEYIHVRRRRDADARYAQSFRDVPETDDEARALDAYARSARAWEDDDW